MNLIIVRSQADMDRILDWMVGFLNQDFSITEDGKFMFRPAFYDGELILQGDGTKAHFDCIGKAKVQFDVTTEKQMRLGTFVFDYENYEVSQMEFDAKYVDIQKALASDAEVYSHYQNLGVKWMAIMLLSANYRPEFERTVKTVGTKQGDGKKKKRGKSTKTIYTKKYILDSSFVNTLPKMERKHAKPNWEFGVRGHYRRYKSGKVVWIRPHVRCKGRGGQADSVYIANMA